MAHRLAEVYSKLTAFFTVYIKEAHAADVYPLGSHVVVKEHSSLAQRVDACNSFAAATSWQLPLLVDGMDNRLMTRLGAHPERFFVVEPARDGRSRLLFCSPGRQGGVQLSDLESFLQQECCVWKTHIEHES